MSVPETKIILKTLSTCNMGIYNLWDASFRVTYCNNIKMSLYYIKVCTFVTLMEIIWTENAQVTNPMKRDTKGLTKLLSNALIQLCVLKSVWSRELFNYILFDSTLCNFNVNTKCYYTRTMMDGKCSFDSFLLCGKISRWNWICLSLIALFSLSHEISESHYWIILNIGRGRDPDTQIWSNTSFSILSGRSVSKNQCWYIQKQHNISRLHKHKMNYRKKSDVTHLLSNSPSTHPRILQIWGVNDEIKWNSFKK